MNIISRQVENSILLPSLVFPLITPQLSFPLMQWILKETKMKGQTWKSSCSLSGARWSSPGEFCQNSELREQTEKPSERGRLLLNPEGQLCLGELAEKGTHICQREHHKIA